jgi:GTPase SAR1 family protein
MKIVIAGAQCTGKSTLLNELKKEVTLSHFTFFNEIVRSLVKEEGIKINRNADYESQISIFKKHKENSLIPDFVSDRSSIDAFVYSYKNFKAGCFTENEFLEFESLFLETSSLYDKIFFLPVEFEITSDGFRDTDKSYQKEINDLFLEVFYLYGINFISLTGDIIQRLERFKFHIL